MRPLLWCQPALHSAATLLQTITCVQGGCPELGARITSVPVTFHLSLTVYFCTGGVPDTGFRHLDICHSKLSKLGVSSTSLLLPPFRCFVDIMERMCGK